MCMCVCVRVSACVRAGSGAWQGLRHRLASHLDGQALDGETARGRDNLLELEFVLGRRFALDQRRVVDRAALGLGVEHRELPSEGVGGGRLGAGAGHGSGPDAWASQELRNCCVDRAYSGI